MEIEESTPTPEAAPDAPVGEAPPEAPADDPAVEVPAEEAPAEEGPASDPYGDFGGRDTVEAAIRLYEASKTEAGVVDIFVEAARAIGLSNEQIQALFADGEATPEDDVDLDEPMTRRQWLEEQERLRQESQQTEAQRTHTAASKAVAETFTKLGLDGDDNADARALVLTLGEKHFDRNNVSPEAAAAAVRAGHAEYLATIERESKRYLKEKVEVAETVPSAPSGAGPAAEPPAAEPKDVAEAIARTRKQLFGNRA